MSSSLIQDSDHGQSGELFISNSPENDLIYTASTA